MALEQWANLADILGVLGLIASLVYVGQQVRLNREQLKADAASRYYERFHDIWTKAALDRNFGEVWSRAANDFDSLDKVDRERIINFEIAALYVWSQWYEEMGKDLLPPNVRRSFEWLLAGIGSRQSVLEAWRISKDSFDDSFQKFIEGHLG